MTRSIPRWLIVAAVALIPSLAFAAGEAVQHGWCPLCSDSCPLHF